MSLHLSLQNLMQSPLLLLQPRETKRAPARIIPRNIRDEKAESSFDATLIFLSRNHVSKTRSSLSTTWQFLSVFAGCLKLEVHLKNKKKELVGNRSWIATLTKSSTLH